jgi:colicin import membrane protein
MLLTNGILHVSFFILMALKTFILPQESITLEPAIRVDLVDLPDKLTGPQALPEPETKTAEPVKPATEAKAPPKTSAEMKPVPKDVFDPRAKAKKKALDKLKELEKAEKKRDALEQIEKQVAAQEIADANARREKVKQSLIKGNVLSAGTSLTGLNKSQFNTYLDVVVSRVKSHWNLPEWLQNSKLRAVVVVYLDESGNITKRTLVKPSGDQRFDDLALKAVDESTPLPRPPEKFTEIVKHDGLQMGFPD